MARTVTADFRQLLQTKLEIGRAQLYRKAEKITNLLSISTADAILLLAAKNHINLHKQGVEPDKIAEIRRLLPHIQSAAPLAAVSVASSHATKRKARGKQPFRVKLPRAEDDPILAKGTHAEMQAMVPVYERLYHLENSIRQFITRVVKAKHGDNWWDMKAPNGLKTHVTGRRADDQVNAWHQRRSNNPIDYLDLNQLAPLVRSTLADFVPAFFPTMEWFQQFIDEVYRSRCVVCHMNPLNQNNIDAVGVRFNQWRELINTKADDLERLEHPAAPPAAPAHLDPPESQPSATEVPPTAPLELEGGRARTAQIKKCLKDRHIYSPKDIRDFFFAALKEADTLLKTEPLTAGRLLGKAMARAKELAKEQNVSFKFWSHATDAMLETTLAAGVLVGKDGAVLKQTARASLVSSVDSDLVNKSEKYLLKYVIATLGDIRLSDRTALAFALFKESPTKKEVFEMQQRVDELVAALILTGEVAKREDDLLSVEGKSAAGEHDAA